MLKIDADAPVLEAVKQMVDANVGSLLVTDGGEVTGIVTERDYLRRVAHEGPGGRRRHRPRHHVFAAGRRRPGHGN